ncbi:MAG: sensor histidine kinase, partial [Flavobacteriaceae bacterium]
IHQIDTLSTIASAFSNFAEMPAQKSELLDVVKIAQLAMDIFTEKYMVLETPDQPLLARLDRTQLIRILTNLVKNAIQACAETPNPSILVQIEGIDNKVCIRVIDNGTGIATENLDKIFEPKFTTKSSGMGLGLPMVKNIVETYEGHIEFESNAANGTVFRVWLPLVNAET